MTTRGYRRISRDAETSAALTKQTERVEAASGPVVWYEDASVSGTVPFAERPGGGSLMADLEPGDVLVAMSLDRVARSVLDLLTLVKVLDEQDVAVRFIDSPIDTTGAHGKFTLTLLGALAELERAIVSERRIATLATLRRQGKHGVGKAPLGFRSMPSPDGRGLVLRPDPETAPMLRQAIERVMAGEPQDTVRHMLGLSRTGMHKILRNPRLAGMTPDDGGVVLVDGVPRIDREAALLTLAEWRALQEYLSVPEAKAWSKARGYGAALRCEVCGERMYFTKGRKIEYSTYACRRVKHEPGVTSPTVTVRLVDDLLEQTFLDNWADEPEVEQIVADSASVRDEAVALARVTLEAAQEAFRVAVSDEEERQALDSLRDAKNGLREAEALPVERVTTTRPTGRTYGDAWAAADDDERSHLLLTCLGPAVVRPGRMPIEEKVTWG